MEIKIVNLQNDILELKKKYDIFYDNYLNLYNNYSDCSHYWIDNDSKKFFDILLEEKKKIKYEFYRIKRNNRTI